MTQCKKTRKAAACASRAWVGGIAAAVFSSAGAQVSQQGVSPGSNTARSFVDASIVRDSGINQPLDLLNDFYPMIQVEISKRDNIRRRSDVQEDDLRTVVAPSLGYRTNIGRHSFYAAYSGIYTYHDDFGGEDSQANSLIAQLGLDLSRSWNMNLFAGVGESFEERGVSGSRGFDQLIIGEDTGPDETEYEYYGADLVYGRNVSPLNASIGFERYENRYTNNFQGDDNPQGSRDRKTDSVHLDLSYKIGAKTSVFGRIQQTDVNYGRELNSLDSEQTDVIVGLRWKPTNALSGVVGIGTSDREYDDGAREEFDDEIYYVNLNYMLNPFSTIELGASRAVEEPGDGDSDFYVSDFLGIGWDHSLTPHLAFSAYAKWIEDDYNTGREDRFFDYGLGLDYAWKSWMTAGIFYGEIDRDSDLDTAGYDDKYFGIRLRSDLRSLLKGRGSRIEPAASFGLSKPSDR